MATELRLEEYFYSSITAYCHKDKSFLSSLRTIMEIILKDMHSSFITLDELIKNYSHGEVLDRRLLELKNLCNSYIHGNAVEVIFDKYGFDRYFKPINDLIDLAQRKYNLNYSIRYEQDKLLFYEPKDKSNLSEQIPISLRKDFGNGHKRFATHTLKTFFKEDFIESDIIYGQKNVIISGGYFSEDECISFNKPQPTKDVKNENVIFKAIYNLLLRNDVIPIPENLKAKGLSYTSLKKIYAMECLFSCVASNLNRQTITITTSNEEKELMEYALLDLKEMYDTYWLLLEAVVDRPQYLWPTINVETDEDLFELNYIINDESYEIKYVSKEVFTTNLYLIAIKNYNLHYDELNSNAWDYFAKLIFGYSGLKIGQQNVLEKSLNESTNGRIPCNILPTGYGKSAIYQLTAFLMPKISFVISPTLILIRDQLNNLRDVHGNKMAKVLPNEINTNSLETTALLYYSDANSLFNEEHKKTFEILARQNYLGFFNIDECHQISIWSQNFDFNYLTLTNFILSNMPGVKVVMYTATANDNVQDDLISRFNDVPKGCKSREVIFIIAGTFKRDHIIHQKFGVKDNNELLNQFKQSLLEALNRAEEDEKEHRIPFENIVVINNDIKLLESAYEYVKDVPFGDETLTIGDVAVFYGSMMEDAYSLFINGLRKVIFASDEFSIGINISSIKTIITLGTPLSKEWYYQETGRVCRISEMGLDKADSNIIDGYAIDIFIDDKNFIKPMNISNINSLSHYHNALYSNLNFILDTFTRYQFDVEHMEKVFGSGNKVSKPYAFSDKLENSYIHSTSIYLSFVSGIIDSYVGSVNKDNKSIVFNVLYNLKFDNINQVESKIIKFAKRYQTLPEATKQLANEIKYKPSVKGMLEPFVKWYYSSLLYQVNQAFINSQTMLLNSTNEKLEEELELTFTAKLLDKQPPRYLLIGVELGPLVVLNNELSTYTKSKDTTEDLFKKYLLFINKKIKKLSDSEILAVLENQINKKNLPIFNWIYGYYEMKNNYEPTRFLMAKHEMSKEEYKSYIQLIVNNTKFVKDLKEEFILSLIQVVSVNTLKDKEIINKETKPEVIHILKMLEAVNLFGMGE